MKNFHIVILLATWFTLIASNANAQSPEFLSDNQPEQDACGAIWLCIDTFSTTNSYHGVGQVAEPYEEYAHWLKVKIGAPGKLVFKIRPKLVNNTYADNYNFFVFQQDSGDCSDVQNMQAVRNNTSPPVVTFLGETGLNTSSNSEFSSSNTFSKYLDVTSGQTIYILINNYGPLKPNPCLWDCYLPTRGYKIDFTGSTCTFVKGGPASIDSVGLNCTNNKFVNLHFSKPILCSSIQDLASDFEIPNASLYLAVGVGCSTTNLVTNNVRVEFAPYITQPGNYELKIKEGTDGNTLVDLCGDQIPVGEKIPFVVGDFDSSVMLTLCPAQMPYNWNNQVINNPGNNISEFTSTSFIGCDSVSTLSINLQDTLKGSETLFICSAELPYTWNGNVINGPGQNVSTFYSLSINGCDSVTTLNLNIISPQHQTLNLSGCGSLIFEGNTFLQSTNISDTVKSNFGCDSLYRNINITIFPAINPVTINVDTVGCGYISFKDRIYRESGFYIDTLRSVNNCDSVFLNYHIIIYPNSQPRKAEETVSNCDVVNYEGKTYFQDTTITTLLKTQQGCDSLLRTTHIVIKSLDLSIIADPAQPVKGDYLVLSAVGNVPFEILKWLPADNFKNQAANQQSFIIQQEDSFWVIGRSETGCIDTAVIFLKPDSLIPVALMPNAFTPNGDGLNDEFQPFFVNKSSYLVKRFQIFDRWGKLVYQASATKKAAWNGNYGNGEKPANAGTYFYYIDIEFIDHTKKSFKGEITLIR
jgi:gliding motility-associated-like protein